MAWKPDYVSGAELQAYVRTGDWDDTELALVATAASRAIDDHCNRQFGQLDAAAERRYTPRWDYFRCRWVVEIDDLMVAPDSFFIVGQDNLTYDLEPINAAAEGMPWTRLVVDVDSEAQPLGEDHEIHGIARWGWSAVPSSVKVAARLQGSRFMSRRESPHGIAGSPEGELRLLSKLDPDVAVSLRGYCRPRSAA